jgi:hypothetical protein
MDLLPRQRWEHEIKGTLREAEITRELYGLQDHVVSSALRNR